MAIKRPTHSYPSNLPTVGELPSTIAQCRQYVNAIGSIVTNP